MHIFNPPSPHCTARCGNCPNPPKYWLFEFDSYTGIDALDNQVAVPAFKTVLKFREIGLGFLTVYPTGLKCFWGVRNRRFDEPELRLEYTEHNFYAPWFLYKDPLNTDWRILLQSHNGDHAEWQLPAGEAPEDNGGRHFKCLSPNTFEWSPSDSDFFAWNGISLPETVTISPFYP